MSNAWVVFAYVVVYGTIAAYGVWLMLRLRTARRGAGAGDEETLAGSAVVPPLVAEE